MEGGDFYELLGVSRWAGVGEIRSAYRRLLLTHHPDHGGSPAAFQRLQDAYATLADPRSRRAYDRHLGSHQGWVPGGGEDRPLATAIATARRSVVHWWGTITALPVLSGTERRRADLVIAAGLAGLLVCIVVVVLLLKATHGLVMLLALGLGPTLWYRRRARVRTRARTPSAEQPARSERRPPGIPEY